MNRVETAMERLEHLDAQAQTELMRGVTLRKKENGIPVLRIHYTANPDRDPETEAGAVWYEKARADYSSQSAWDREQEIAYLAGGGERVFAKVLEQHHDAVIISDPRWHPDPRWDWVGGFDHGKTNATAFLKAYIDFEGNIYFAGEFYSYAREGWVNDVAMNAPLILQMPGFEKMRWCMADPSIFPDGELQSDGTYSSVNKTYIKSGVKFLKPYEGERSDMTFVEWLLSGYWKGLDQGRTPTLSIVCRNKSDRLQPGLHPYDCPNLVWELNRTKKAQLTARQLMTRNPTEKIVDKQNHARDAMKYILGTLRRPSEMPVGSVIQQAVAGLNPTSAQLAAQRIYVEHMRKKSKTINMMRKGRMR